VNKRILRGYACLWWRNPESPRMHCHLFGKTMHLFYSNYHGYRNIPNFVVLPSGQGSEPKTVQLSFSSFSTTGDVVVTISMVYVKPTVIPFRRTLLLRHDEWFGFEPRRNWIKTLRDHKGQKLVLRSIEVTNFMKSKIRSKSIFVFKTKVSFKVFQRWQCCKALFLLIPFVWNKTNFNSNIHSFYCW